VRDVLAQTQHTDGPYFRRERQTGREFVKQEASLARTGVHYCLYLERTHLPARREICAPKEDKHVGCDG